MLELKGTEKQVKWANDIRETVLKGLIGYKEFEEQIPNERARRRRVKFVEKAKNAIETIQNETTSKYFIDNFAFILRNLDSYKIEAEIREIDVNYLIGCAVLEKFAE